MAVPVPDEFDLDFASILDPAKMAPAPAPEPVPEPGPEPAPAPAPEPVPIPEQDAAMRGEAIIGDSNPASNGFYVQLFPDAPSRPPAAAPPTILVIEDDEVTSALLKRILVKEGYKALLAANRAGIEVGMRGKPDMVILDVLLPDADGFDILNRIRSSSSRRTLPVLMLSSLGAQEHIMKAGTMGANGYLTKPANSKALLKAIDEVMFK